MSIEDIILDHDRRGVSALRPYLPSDYCHQAAQFIQEHPGTTFIVTGFYIISAGKAETDGPPGAVALGKALQALGRGIVYVTDRYTAAIMQGLGGEDAEVIDFPIAGHEESQRFARELLERFQPPLVISTERCSPTSQGVYLNMRGVDISAYTAKVDYLFYEHPHTIGIGDGGNEIGMGNLAEVIPQVPSLPQHPAATRTTHLLVASVSNWGALGLVAALSQLVGRDLLPSLEEEAERIKQTVQLGAVDGMSTKPEYKVDSFSLEENGTILDRLHEAIGLLG